MERRQVEEKNLQPVLSMGRPHYFQSQAFNCSILARRGSGFEQRTRRQNQKKKKRYIDEENLETTYAKDLSCRTTIQSNYSSAGFNPFAVDYTSNLQSIDFKRNSKREK